jgi:hypothetical protein
VSEEQHQNGGRHFHMAIKLNTKSRWLRARNYIDEKHGIKVNFSDHHDNYYGAYKYVTKEDAEFIVSPDHPDLSNTTGPPKTSNATKKRKCNRKALVNIRCCTNYTTSQNYVSFRTYGVGSEMER